MWNCKVFLFQYIFPRFIKQNFYKHFKVDGKIFRKFAIKIIITKSGLPIQYCFGLTIKFKLKTVIILFFNMSVPMRVIIFSKFFCTVAQPCMAVPMHVDNHLLRFVIKVILVYTNTRMFCVCVRYRMSTQLLIGYSNSRLFTNTLARNEDKLSLAWGFSCKSIASMLSSSSWLLCMRCCPSKENRCLLLDMPERKRKKYILFVLRLHVEYSL